MTFKNFDDARTRPYYVMSSFAEKKAMSLAAHVVKGGNPLEFNSANCRQFSRVYPNGKRVDSSNFDPQTLWNVGVQMAALNYQTPGDLITLHLFRHLRQTSPCG